MPGAECAGWVLGVGVAGEVGTGAGEVHHSVAAANAVGHVAAGGMSGHRGGDPLRCGPPDVFTVRDPLLGQLSSRFAAALSLPPPGWLMVLDGHGSATAATAARCAVRGFRIRLAWIVMSSRFGSPAQRRQEQRVHSGRRIAM